MLTSFDVDMIFIVKFISFVTDKNAKPKKMYFKLDIKL